MFENDVSEPLVTTAAILLGSKWSVLLLRIVLQEVSNVFSELRILVNVDDMKLCQQEISCDLLERTRNLNELLIVATEKILFELSVTEGGKEGVLLRHIVTQVKTSPSPVWVQAHFTTSGTSPA